jgi:L-alanine-DL-glutamate epimerase-like enolase superfamily enzyme
MTTTTLRAEIESFAIAGRFTISRGSKTEAQVIRVELERDGVIGTGECVPYARYGETLDATLAAILSLRDAFAAGLDRTGLQSALPPGAARNALDCALWDLEAALAGRSVVSLAGIAAPGPIETAYTISLDTAEAMADAARRHSHMPLLKLKLGAPGDADRLAAIRAAVPETRLIVDANEGWLPDELQNLLHAAQRAGIELVEQPLPAGNDALLAEIDHVVPICADESVHALAGLEHLVGRYDAINVKLDLNLAIMVGCMVSTSLSMMPASLLAPFARWVDLDGPLLLAADRPGGLTYTNGVIDPTGGTLWGTGKRA